MKKHATQKIIVLLFCLFSVLHSQTMRCTVSAIKTPVTLLNLPLLVLADGKSWGIDDKVILLIFKMRKKIIELQKKLLFRLDGKEYTLETIDPDDPLFHSDDEAIQQMCRAALYEAKNEFYLFSKDFLEMIHGVKTTMIVIIEEWTRRAKRENSVLLRWKDVHTLDGYKTCFNEVDSLPGLQQLMKDIREFLECLVKSCPKACAQFQKFIDQQASHKK